MRLFSFSSLRVRLLLLVLLAVLPALWLTFNADLEMRELREAQVRENTLRLTRLAAGDLIQVIEGTRQLLVGLAQLPEVREGEPDQCNSLFADLLEQYPHFVNLGVIRRDNHLFCSAVPGTMDLKEANRDYFERFPETRGFSISGYQIEPATGKATVHFAYPVLNGTTGTVQAVVFAALNLNWFHQLEAEAQLPKGSSLMVMDHKGTILARYPESEKWVGKPVGNTPIAQAFLNQQSEGVIEIPGLDGVLRLYAFTPVQGTPDTTLYVGIGISKETAFGPAEQVFRQNLVGLALVGALALIAAWFVGNTFIVSQVNALVTATHRLAEGDLSARIGPPYGRDEISKLARSFDAMAESLEQHSIELRDSREQLRDLTAHLESVREEERTRIAREIHDELGQALTGLKMDLSWMEKRIAETQEGSRKSLLIDKTRSMMKLIDTIIQSVRKIVTELRPGVLDDLGLTAAIEWQASEFQERTGIWCTLSLPAEDILLDQNRSSAIFRIFQEILTNVARHANANRVDIRLTEERSHVVLEVRDNGKGIEEDKISHAKSLGLLGMRERAHLLKGEFLISGAPGKGTLVTVSIPSEDHVPLNGFGKQENGRHSSEGHFSDRIKG